MGVNDSTNPRVNFYISIVYHDKLQHLCLKALPPPGSARNTLNTPIQDDMPTRVHDDLHDDAYLWGGKLKSITRMLW